MLQLRCVHSFFSVFPDFPIYHLGGVVNREIGKKKSLRSLRKGLHGTTTVVQPPRIRLYGLLFVCSIVNNPPYVVNREIGKTEKRKKKLRTHPVGLFLLRPWLLAPDALSCLVLAHWGLQRSARLETRRLAILSVFRTASPTLRKV